VNPCPHAVHNRVWTQLRKAKKIVDVGPVIALVAAATALAGPAALDPERLPVLPERGLARYTKAGVELQTMRGVPLGVLPRLSLAPDVAISRDLLMRDRRGSLFLLDRRARRVRQISDGPPRRRACRVTDRRGGRALVVCKAAIKLRTPSGRLRVAAKAPGRIGHWERAAFAPRGNAFFAQWSAECEIPVAFLIADGVMRPFGARKYPDVPSSMALGWLPNGSAVVHFPESACGRTHRPAGVYAVPRRGDAMLLVRTPRHESYWMWGG
jgi:hypothetical protein